MLICTYRESPDRFKSDLRKRKQQGLQIQAAKLYTRSDATLPFRGISPGVKDCENDNDLSLNRKVDSIRKSPCQCPPDPRAKFLVSEWAFSNSVVRSAQLIEELNP